MAGRLGNYACLLEDREVVCSGQELHVKLEVERRTNGLLGRRRFKGLLSQNYALQHKNLKMA